MRGWRKNGEALALALFLLALSFCVACPSQSACQTCLGPCLYQAPNERAARIVPPSGQDDPLSDKQLNRFVCGVGRLFSCISEAEWLSSLVAAFLLAAVMVWFRLIDLRTRQIVGRGGLHAPPEF